MIPALTDIAVFNPAGFLYIANDKGGTQFPVTNLCERTAKIMGEDSVRLVFNHTKKVVFDAFSYIEYNGQRFWLKEKYIPTPNGTRLESGVVTTPYYSYDVKFVSTANMLEKFICYRHVVVGNDSWDEPEININGNLETLYVIVMGSIQQAVVRLRSSYSTLIFADDLQLLVDNGIVINSAGVQEPNLSNVKLTAGTKLLTFNFSGDNISNVCTTIANNFTKEDKKDTEWYIKDDTLHFVKCVDEDYGTQYINDYALDNLGSDKSVHPYKTGGLKKVEYTQAWSGISNVIVPYGSDRNMSYRSVKGIDEITQMQSTFGKRLRLEPSTLYKVTDKNGSPVYFTTDANGGVRNEFVDTGIEQVMFYDEIYPQGHFRITSVEVKNKRQNDQIIPEYTIEAEPIDTEKQTLTDIGFYPIKIEEGTTLSVRFESGYLNGREFEIANKTKKDEGATTYSMRFTIVADGSIEDGTLIPSGNFIPFVGDEFALFNMKMPDIYITAAQQVLAQRAYDDLVEQQEKRPDVKCSTDPTSWSHDIGLGYKFKVESELFNSGSEFISRVIEYSYKLPTPLDIQFTLASAIMQGTLTSMNDQIIDVTNTAGGLDQRTVNLSRRGWRDASEMSNMLNSLASDMMLAGNERYQFAFTAGINVINQTINGVNRTTSIKIGEGTLQHTQEPYTDKTKYACEGWWTYGATILDSAEVSGGIDNLVNIDSTPLYLYAIVGSNDIDIEFKLCETEYSGTADEAYLLLGILSSEFEGLRVFNRTNGFTQIAGGTITTEQIQDAGRNLIIDFGSNPPCIIARGKAKITGNIEFNLTEEQAEDIANRIEIGVIGGENLCPTPAIQYDYNNTSQIGFTKLINNLEAGEKYIASYVKFEDNCGTADEWAKGVCLVVSTSPYAENIEAVYNFGDVIEVNGNGRGLYVAWGIYDYIDYIKGTTPSEEITQTAFTQYLDGVMVQKGERATSYQEYVQHITNALQGSTDISGGLVMTNLLMLKNKEGNVTAGMSGVKDDNVLLWGGGSYDDALELYSNIITLFRKDGTARIGKFEVLKDNVQVATTNGKVIIDDDEGISCVRQEESEPVVKVTPSELSALELMSGEPITGTAKFTLQEQQITGRDVNDFTIVSQIEKSTKTFGKNTTLTISGGIITEEISSSDRVQVWTEQDADNNGTPRDTCMVVDVLKDGKSIGTYFLNGVSQTSATITLEDAGEYTFEYHARVKCVVTDAQDIEQQMTVKVNGYVNMSYSYTRLYNQTTIAYKGFFSYQGDAAYFYYKDGVGLECRIGNVIFKVTSSGIIMEGLDDASSVSTKPIGTIYKDQSGFLKVKTL